MDFKAIKNGYLECDKGFVTFGRGMGKIVRIPVYCFLVRHEKGNVLIDTGFCADYKNTWGKRLKFFRPILENDIAQLKENNIDYIINTHLHIDHCENNAMFKSAQIIVQQKEIETARNPPLYQKLAYQDKLDETPNYFLINGGMDLFDDGKINIVETFGHTPGHQSVLLDFDGKSIFIAGDACYNSENLEHNCLSGIVWNPDKIMECYGMMRNLKNTQIIFGHEEPKFEMFSTALPE